LGVEVSNQVSWLTEMLAGPWLLAVQVWPPSMLV